MHLDQDIFGPIFDEIGEKLVWGFYMSSTAGVKLTHLRPISAKLL